MVTNLVANHIGLRELASLAADIASTKAPFEILKETCVEINLLIAATVWGRAGGIIAPFVGGYLLDMHMPMQQLMIWAALPCVTTTLIGIGLGMLYTRHFNAPVAAAMAAE